MLKKMPKNMKLILLFVVLYASISHSFLTFKDFKRGSLLQCYDERPENRLIQDTFNGPLPSSLETFVALIERLENAYPSMATTDIIQKLLVSFRVDQLDARFRRWAGQNTYEVEKAFFNVLDSPTYPWKEEDFSEDEKCTLHFMLSHSVNTSALGNNKEELEEDGETTKTPREIGVVSLHGKRKHSFSLSKVLLGILAGLSGNNQVNAIDIYRKIKGSRKEESLDNVKVNRLIGVTIGDIISVYINERYKSGLVAFYPNGLWNDGSCPTQYTLLSNNKMLVTNSDIRGAVDGLIIGKKLEEKLNVFQKVRLSQILRMYYGPTGLMDNFDVTTRSDTQWCNRERNFESIINLRDEVYNFHKLYSFSTSSVPTDQAAEEISEVLSYLSKSSEIFNEVAAESSSECGGSELSLDKRCTTPFDIFAILDFSTNDIQRNFQIEVIGNLSTSFDVRPNGNSIGVYTNLNPSYNKGLHTIVNNTGISGCQACFAKYYSKRSSKNSEAQVFENLNVTLTEFVSAYDFTQNEIIDVKNGAPSKVILYFNYASSINNDYKLRDAIAEIERSFREVTVIAVGSSKDALIPFTENDDTDIFQLPSSASNAADFAAKLKARICKAPAEFQFKKCNQSSRTTEAENRQTNIIGLNKKQYWAMYPKYFLKSNRIVLKFKPLEGAQIKVCYSRYYFRIIEDNPQYTECFESSGDEIKFYTNNPCHRYNEYNCDPFYFSIESKKAPNAPCENPKCSTLKDIQFEFQHEGITCNSASFLSSSVLALLVSLVLITWKNLK